MARAVALALVECALRGSPVCFITLGCSRNVAGLPQKLCEQALRLGGPESARNRITHMSFEVRFGRSRCMPRPEFLHFHGVAPRIDGAIFLKARAR